MSRKRKNLLLICSALIVAALAVGAGWWYRSQYAKPRPAPVSPHHSTPVKQANGQIIKLTHLRSMTADQVNTDAKVVYGPNAPSAATDIEVYQVTYQSQDARNGQKLELTGRFYVPHQALTTGFVFGPGTTGIAPQCSASLERSENKNWGRYDNHMEFYAAQGYPVAIPDYDGRQTGGTHHYFVGAEEGKPC